MNPRFDDAGLLAYGSGLSIEQRSGRFYAYVRKRVDGRLHGRYLRRMSFRDAALFRACRLAEQERRANGRLRVTELNATAARILAAGHEFDRRADLHFQATMRLAGFRLHKRSDWRLQRGALCMLDGEDLHPTKPRDAATASTPAPRSAPRRAIITPYSNDPEIQTTLDRAAAGDASVLPQVRQLLKHPSYLDGLGDVESFALDRLLEAAAGDNLAVREGVRVKYEQTLARLLADGGQDPSFAELIAATRAAHATITVNIVELLANREVAGSPAALALERHLGRAEKRLSSALKSMAALRRLRKRVVVKQVNVANGPMVVNNRRVAPSLQRSMMSEEVGTPQALPS